MPGHDPERNVGRRAPSTPDVAAPQRPPPRAFEPAPDADSTSIVTDVPLHPVVVNADDLGASNGINRGIVEAHLHGLVTSTSLMVNVPATAHAVASVAELDTLSVGLHVNFTNEGEPILDLNDAAAARSELSRQIEEFERLFGRLPTHLDSHHDVHARPELQDVFLDAATEIERPLRGRSGVRYIAQYYGQQDGATRPEQLSVPALLRVLRHAATGGPSEVSCHPGYRDPAFESVYHDERELELQSLCDERAKSGVHAMGLRLVSHDQLRGLGSRG